MPLAFLTGLDRDVTLFPFLQQTLSFDNILYLGIRDLDEGEKQVLKEKNIKFIKSADINKDPDAAFNMIRAFVGKDPVHLSFDVDGIDPSEMPCTGTVASRGVRVDAVKPILDKIMKKTNLINLDITEFNLEIGNEREKDVSIRNFIKLFRKYL
jgi:arginase